MQRASKIGRTSLSKVGFSAAGDAAAGDAAAGGAETHITAAKTKTRRAAAKARRRTQSGVRVLFTADRGRCFNNMFLRRTLPRPAPAAARAKADRRSH
jgi:hypothetical protein